MFDKISSLIMEYHSQIKYPFALSIILNEIDKEAEKLENAGIKNVRKSASWLMFEMLK